MESPVLPVKRTQWREKGALRPLAAAAQRSPGVSAGMGWARSGLAVQACGPAPGAPAGLPTARLGRSTKNKPPVIVYHETGWLLHCATANSY